MNVAETTVTFDDCAAELKHMLEIRRSGLRECVESKSTNKMTRQAAHVALAKLTGALQMVEEIRTSDGVAARAIRRPRTVKTIF